MSRLNESRVLKHPGSTSEAAMIGSKISISDNNRRKLVELLNARLIDMQTQMKFAHWNVKGENFYQLHLLFDTIAEHMEDAVDLIAERITALGGRANGTARQVASGSSLKEYDLDIVTGMDHVPHSPGSPCGRGECIAGGDQRVGRARGSRHLGFVH
jgi:hypothetical protein